MSATKDLLTISDLVRSLRENGLPAAYSTVHRKVIEGTYPATRFGQAWCIKATDLPEIMAIENARASRRPAAAYA